MALKLVSNDERKRTSIAQQSELKCFKLYFDFLEPYRTLGLEIEQVFIQTIQKVSKKNHCTNGLCGPTNIKLRTKIGRNTIIYLCIGLHGESFKSNKL